MFKDLFTLSGRWGRLNRLRFFGLVVLSVVIWMSFLLLLFVLGLMLAAMGGAGTDAGIFTVLGIGILLMLIPLYVLFIWIQVCLAVKRLHDLNQSGLWVLALLGYSFASGTVLGFIGEEDTLMALLSIPNLVFGAWLLFWPGTEGDNQYGPDPLQMK